MNGEILYECGVDLNSSLTFEDGDIKLVKYEDNLKQAIINRLNCNLDELDLLYEDYGSVLSGFIGWKQDDALPYIETEVNQVLLNEPRLIKHDISVGYNGNGVVEIDLVLYTTSNNAIGLNLVFDSNGVVEVDANEEEVIDEEEE